MDGRTKRAGGPVHCESGPYPPRNGHEHRDSQVLRHLVGFRADDEGVGAPASQVPRAPARARSGRPDQGARRGDRPLVRHSRRQGQVGRRAPCRARHHARVQDRGDRRLAAHPADQLARPDQRPEGLQPDRRRAGESHQLVGPDHDGDDDRRLEIRHEARRRHHALLQHDQWRPGVRARQGRQDRAHDADRFRRHRPAALDHSRARHEIHGRRARPRWRPMGRTRNRSSIRPTACCIP
jgi:hypothetical protein